MNIIKFSCALLIFTYNTIGQPTDTTIEISDIFSRPPTTRIVLFNLLSGQYGQGVSFSIINYCDTISGWKFIKRLDGEVLLLNNQNQQGSLFGVAVGIGALRLPKQTTLMPLCDIRFLFGRNIDQNPGEYFPGWFFGIEPTQNILITLKKKGKFILEIGAYEIGVFSTNGNLLYDIGLRFGLGLQVLKY